MERVDLFALVAFAGPLLGCSSPNEHSTFPQDAEAARPDSMVAQNPECLGRGSSPTASGSCGCNEDCDPGESCITEAPAAAGVGATNFGSPGGECLRGCSPTTPCPGSLACVEGTLGDPSTSVCVPTCQASTQCRTGYVCQPILGYAGTYCLGLCQSDSDCTLTHACNRYLGVCDTPVADGGDIGAACAKDGDCRSSFCAGNPPFIGGYCTAFCSLSEQGCPTQSACALPFTDGGDLGACFRSCRSTADCRLNYACEISPVDAGITVCAPM